MTYVSDGLTAYTDTVHEARRRGALLAQVQAQNKAIPSPAEESVPVESKCSNLSLECIDPSDPKVYILTKRAMLPILFAV